MLPKDKIIVDGTKPSEGGEIEVDHMQGAMPGQTITPQQPKEDGLKPFNQQIINDIDKVNNHQDITVQNNAPIEQQTVNTVASNNPAQSQNAPAAPTNQASELPATSAQGPAPLPPVAPMPNSPQNNMAPTPPEHAPEPDHSGMYSTNPAYVNTQPPNPAFHPNKSVIGTPDNFNNLSGPIIAGQGGVSNITTAPAPKKSKRKLLFIIIPIIILVVMAAYFFGFYWPNTPQNVWNTGLGRSGKQFSAIIDKLSDKDALMAYEKTAIKLEGTIEVDGQKVQLNIDTNYDATKSDTKAAVQSNSNDLPLQLEAKVKTNLPQDALLPNAYFNISGFKDLGLDGFIPGINKYDGKWVAVEQDFLKQFEENLNAQPEDDATGPSYEEVISVVNDFNSVTQQYVFNADPNYSVLMLEDFIGTEDSEGIKANHYKAKINNENTTKYCVALIDKLAANQTVKKYYGLDGEDYDKQVQEQKDDCVNTDEEANNNETFDIWFDKKYKLLHKIRVYADNESFIKTLQDQKKQENYYDCLSNATKSDQECQAILKEPVDIEVDLGTEYTEFGQIYSSKNEILMFANYKKENKDDNTNLRLELNVNTDNLAFGGSMALTSKSEYSDTKMNIKITTEPYSGEVDGTKPSGAIPIQEMLKDLLGTENPYANVQANARDSKRQSDISSLHTALEAYYVVNGEYPSLAQVNDEQFRQDNLKGVPSETFADPKGSSDKLADRVGANVYSYVLVPATCNAKTVKCTYYELSAKLEDGTVYTKQSIQ